MPLIILITLVIIGIILVAILLRGQSGKLPERIHQHLDMIRSHSVLIKPDKESQSFSGRYAGRLMYFSFKDKNIIIRAEAQMGRDESLWIYPINHRFGNDKFRSTLEKNQAWTGNADFDKHFILAGHPRVFANAVIYPSITVQTTLLQFPRAIVEVDKKGVSLHPNVKNESQITPEIWGTWMSLLADIAELVEAQYSPSMFAGIEVDVNAHPVHSRGHLT